MREARSIWLIGGGAALAILALCALIGVTAAAALIWFTSTRSGGETSATQAAARQTAVRITQTIASSQALSTTTPSDQNTIPLASGTPGAGTSPTPLPAPGSVTTLVSIGSQNSTPLPSSGSNVASGDLPPADEAVRAYYDLVSAGSYDATWPMLTDRFKQEYNCCAPNYNYTGYVQWWDSVDRVDFGNVRTVSQNGNRAIVYAELTYIMNGGARNPDTAPYVELAYNDTLGMWQIDDKRRNQ